MKENSFESFKWLFRDFSILKAVLVLKFDTGVILILQNLYYLNINSQKHTFTLAPFFF